ncbi:amidohydrolase [Oscillospiraceae bacterium MB08-C2-2]|nr:amidohydrolase [Oscillospiraceae bacterium MB08-C2-2]
MDAYRLAEEYKDYIVEMRRHFHRNPEVAWQELETARVVEEELEKMGLEPRRVAGTGVIALIEGDQPGPTLGLRADMDALAVQEASKAPYASCIPGTMHACGHDAHTAILLGTARILFENRAHWGGRVFLIFQPAEEVAQGAARILSETQLLDAVERYMAIHVWSLIPVGKVSVDAGPRMAASDSFRMAVRGKGGHGSMPHHTIDPIPVACSVVSQLQHLISRETDPLKPAVVSVCSIKGGSTFNVIPGEVELLGTFRSFDRELREHLPKRVEEIARGVCQTHGAELEFELILGTPAVINDEQSSRIARGAVEKLLGADGVYSYAPITSAEDFAYYQEKKPGVLAFVGCRNEEQGKCWPHHHERFDIDEEALTISAALFVQFVLENQAER